MWGGPAIYNEELFKQRVQQILDSHWFSNSGQFVRALEDKIQNDLGVNHAIAVGNATQGLELCLRLLKPGFIKVPSFTFIGTINAISNTGHLPDFCDIDNNYHMDIRYGLEAPLIHEKTRAFMPVDLFGSLVNHTPQYGLPVIYDSAHAFGCMNGVFGDMQVYSFHPTKAFGGFEGGIIVLDNDENAQKLRNKRSFGYEYNNSNTHGEIVTHGTNAKMSEVAAASILTQIEHKEEIRDIYLSNHTYYKKYLPPWITLKTPNHEFSNYSYVVCEYKNRDGLVDYLNAKGIYARKYFTPCHLQKPYYDPNLKLPNTNRLSKIVFQLPTGITINEQDIKYICSVIESYPL